MWSIAKFSSTTTFWSYSRGDHGESLTSIIFMSNVTVMVRADHMISHDLLCVCVWVDEGTFTSTL